jgi:hypothetical protein
MRITIFATAIAESNWNELFQFGVCKECEKYLFQLNCWKVINLCGQDVLVMPLKALVTMV